MTSQSVLRKKMSNQTTMIKFFLLGFSDIRELQILIFVVFLPLYLISLLGNLLIITAIALDRHLHNPITELVDDLYYFRDHYFESHGVEDAERKQQDVLEEIEKTLQQMGEIDVCSQGPAQTLMLKGKVLNITPDYSPQVEELLAKAVKLDPEVWKNKVLLKNLSMVLQQLQAESAEQHTQNVMDSIQQAKLAVQMDMQDSHLWYILGNANLSLFFNTGQNPNISQQALSAYAQGLHKYEKNYTECQQQLLDFLEHLTSLLEIKGKVKGKKWQSMLGSLHPSQLGPCEDGQYQGSSGQKAALEHRPCS
ncbi:unnamed protein product [Lepidochelys olivacea]